MSQRASAEIAASEDDQVHIEITWASSASEYILWTMDACISEDGLLSYDNCCKTICAGEDEQIEYENGEGYFLIVDGKLQWTGAADEDCKSCIFEKIE